MKITEDEVEMFAFFSTVRQPCSDYAANFTLAGFYTTFSDGPLRRRRRRRVGSRRQATTTTTFGRSRGRGLDDLPRLTVQLL